MRLLERRVAEAGGTSRSDDRTNEPAEVAWTSPDTVEVRLHLRAEVWALVQRAMEGARRQAESESLLSECDALAALARDALERQSEPGPSELRRLVVLYECSLCRRTEVETGTGPIELGASAAAALACGAPVRDLGSEGRIERRGGPMPPAVARAVRLRDRDRCRVPGCSRRRYVDVHHLKAREQGGIHSRRNCLCLCDTHHRMLHDGGLVIAGDPEGAIAFHDANGNAIGEPLEAEAAVTQGGSSGGIVDEAADVGALLLAAMGKRGGWHTDVLCSETGLSAGVVASTLTQFELMGRVRRDARGRYATA